MDIYIYIERERETETDRERERERKGGWSKGERDTEVQYIYKNGTGNAGRR